MMTQIIAVYGSLRRGSYANGLLKGAKYLGQDKISGDLYSLGNYPGLLLDSDEPVLVDLYLLPEDDEGLLISIDRYEGYFNDDEEDSLFVRRKVTTLEGVLEVYIYEYNGTILPQYHTAIPSGDWFDCKGESEGLSS